MKIFHEIDEISKIIDNGVVATIGNFDGVHLGHQLLLKNLNEKSRELLLPGLVITFSPHPKHIQKLTSDAEKISLINADYLLIINFNIEFKSYSAQYFIEEILINKLKVQHLIIGKNFYFGNNRSGDVLLLKKHFASIDIVSLYTINDMECSSSEIRKYLNMGEIKKANKLLGYNYSISGIVIRGRKLASKLGFPTANIMVDGDIILKHGVYKVKVFLFDKIFNAIANFGIKPTVSNENIPLLEVHIPNFFSELYGEHLRVEFIEFIRGEKKFDNLEELVSQIKRDIHENFEFNT